MPLGHYPAGAVVVKRYQIGRVAVEAIICLCSHKVRRFPHGQSTPIQHLRSPIWAGALVSSQVFTMCLVRSWPALKERRRCFDNAFIASMEPCMLLTRAGLGVQGEFQAPEPRIIKSRPCILPPAVNGRLNITSWNLS